MLDATGGGDSERAIAREIEREKVIGFIRPTWLFKKKCEDDRDIFYFSFSYNSQFTHSRWQYHY